MSDPVQSQLPLSEATFFILVSLAGGPKHGYAILKDVEALSDGRLVMSTGTLYGGLKRLLEQDLVVRRPDATADESDRPRYPYELTEHGRRVLAAESRRLQSLVALARRRTALGEA